MTTSSDLSDVLASIEDVLAGDLSPMRPASVAPARPASVAPAPPAAIVVEEAPKLSLEPRALEPLPPRVEPRAFPASLRVHPDKPLPQIGPPRATGTVAEFMASLRIHEAT